MLDTPCRGPEDMLRDDVEEDIGDETFLAGDGLAGPVRWAGVLHSSATCP